MAQDIKEKLYEFLKKNKGKRFNLTELARASGFSWASVSKWAAVLIAEKERIPIVNIEDFGNVKIIWVEDWKEKLSENFMKHSKKKGGK